MEVSGQTGFTFQEVCFVTNFAGMHIFLKAKTLCLEMYGNLGVTTL